MSVQIKGLSEYFLLVERCFYRRGHLEIWHWLRWTGQCRWIIRDYRVLRIASGSIQFLLLVGILTLQLMLSLFTLFLCSETSDPVLIGDTSLECFESALWHVLCEVSNELNPKVLVK